MRQHAILRALELIGEAASNLNLALRQRHPEVPWRAMIPHRAIVIHEYFQVDVGQVWRWRARTCRSFGAD